jgi:SAM-dependent methyltransferase
MPVALWRPLFRLWLSALAADRDRERAVRELLTSYDDVYRRLDQAAIAYEGGVHVKHRLTGYHDFFVERVRPGERVLDLGSGKGELAHDLVLRSGASVVGIDNDPSHLAFARARFTDERLDFREGDVREGIPQGHFDVVVMSNVLEHLEGRAELLRNVVASAAPSRLLFRVPVYARDWTVPLKREVGLPAYWDPDHEIEYDPESFRAELSGAGLEVTELALKWGEIWAVAEP